MSDSDAMAAAFDADISLSMPNQTLYLVIGANQSPIPVVQGINGQVLFQIPDKPAIIALLPIAAYFVLDTDRRIAHVGPVSIDAAKFNHFLELLHNAQQP